MNIKRLLIALCSALCILLSGCVLEDTTDNSDDNTVNVYVKGFYSIKDTGLDGPIFDEEYYLTTRDILLPRHVCEFDGAAYIKENNKVFKSENGKKELLFEFENGIKSIVSANNDYLIFLSCEAFTSNGTEYQYNDFYKYEFAKDKISRIIAGNRLPRKYRIYFKENYIIIQSDYNEEIYFYDLVKDDFQVFEYEKLIKNDTNDSFPEDFYYVCGENIYIYSSKDHSLITSALEYNGEIYEYDNRIRDIRFKTFIYNDDLYNIWTDSKIEDNTPPSHYGNEERCEAKYWVSDNVFKIPLTGETEGQSEGVIKESTNRIVGYNPITNEVYLYVFDNKTITSRNLGNPSEKVVETLKDSETIQFEWIDTRLYWFYINNGLEEYGGCHEFK